MTIKNNSADPMLDRDGDMEMDMDMEEEYTESYGGEDKRCKEEDAYYQVRVSRCKEEPCPKPKPCPEPCYKPCYVPCYEKYPEPCYKPCREKEECRKKERKCSEVLLNAATGGAMLPLVTTVFTTPIQVVSVTLDPDRIDDLAVLLDFTSTINIPATAALTANLNFQVYRSIDNGTPIAIGPTFTFATAVALLSSTSFGFQVFDKNVEGRTVTYSVVVTSGQITTAVGASIINATLSAIGVEK